MKLTLLIYLLYIPKTLQVTSSTGIMSDRKFLADIAVMCPYTSFCGENASILFPGSKEEIPCCYDCSCDQACGLSNNCCFKNLDLYNIEESYKMICKSLIPNAKSTEASQHFRMINKCFSSNKSYTDPQKLGTLFEPTYSSRTGFIYYNAEIAQCNNAANDTISFQKAITCNVLEDYMIDVDRVLRRNDPDSECQTHYMPPTGVNLKSEECKPHIIRKCNVTGAMTEWEPYWAFCELFNATFVLQTIYGEYVYGNIYCYMCNEQFYEKRFKHSIYKCNSWLDKVQGGRQSLTVILTQGLHLSDSPKDNIAKSLRFCPEDMIAIQSFKKLCRPIKCPVWKMLVEGSCRFYSNRWIGGLFAITLRLELALNDSNLDRSFFVNMSRSDRNDKKAKWLKRKTMKRWDIAVFYHPSEDEISVEYLIIEAICPFSSVNPKYIEETINKTFDDQWYIVDKNETVSLTKQFPGGRSYIVYLIEFSESIENNYTYNYALFRAGDLNSSNFNGEPLFYVSDRLYSQSVEYILLTKLYFCHQVDLLSDEYIDNGDNIFFKVKNVTLYDFRRVNSFAQSHVEAVKQTVRVCLSEFGLSSSVQRSNYLSEANVQDLLFKIISILITFNSLKESLS